jgi:chemotaxis protein MotB
VEEAVMRAGRRAIGTVAVAGMAVVLSGCAVRFSKRSPWDIQQIQALSEQLDQFRNLAQLKSEEAEQLRRAKAMLDQRLASEIADDQVSVGFDERGLVVRVLDKVLFDSGKAQVREEAFPVLDKIARVLNEEVVAQPIGVEGHTDNEPIKVSGWKDNTELSMARARSVLDYLVQERHVESGRLIPAAHGEQRPIASNETAEGRRVNRRVEIVVLPQGTSAAQFQSSQPESDVITAFRK